MGTGWSKSKVKTAGGLVISTRDGSVWGRIVADPFMYTGMRTVNIKNSENAEKNSTKDEYEQNILKIKTLKSEDSLKIPIPVYNTPPPPFCPQSTLASCVEITRMTPRKLKRASSTYKGYQIDLVFKYTRLCNDQFLTVFSFYKSDGILIANMV